jgi:hypothetical protein
LTTLRPSPLLRRAPGAAIALVREHWLFLAVLALAAALRVAVALAYPPALFYSDSLVYLRTTYHEFPFHFTPPRPGGYSFFLRLLAPWGPHLTRVTVAQHLAGLVVGVLVYALLVRLGVRRWAATLSSAVVMLDAYALALEQHILSETFFGLAFVGCVYLAATRPRSGPALVASGLLLALATTVRAAGLFAIPVWIVYVAWSRPGWARGTIAAVAAIVPVLAYSIVHQQETGTFGMTQMTGRFLYGRVAPIMDCRGADVPARARRLCALTARDKRMRDKTSGPDYFIWRTQAPSHRAFPRVFSSSSPHLQARIDPIFQDFAVAMIRARPLAYAGVVAGDFLNYFAPGTPSPPDDDSPIIFPASPSQANRVGDEPRKRKLLRRYVPHPAIVRPPAAAVHAYASVVHTPRWLLGPLALLGLTALVPGLVGRLGEPLPHRRQVFLLTGSSLAMLLGSVATLFFTIRYLVPVVPLIVAGGVLGASDLAARFRELRGASGARGSRRSSPA